jgi:DNA repair exonuclease SbcCD nuclease subunit
MSFVHMADMHLGYRQYDLEQRFIDLGHTFKKIIEYAIANKVEFLIISGDLFDKRSINAPTYIQAVHVLSLLKDAGIPCIAIEGNHDRRFIKDGMSWLESLEWEGLLKVIKNRDGSLMGDYTDIGGTRIFGLGFSGSLTSAAIPQMVSEIREINVSSPPKSTILMMHAGVQGKMKRGIIGEVTYEDLYPLKEVVDYLALGHYHNTFDIDGWVYNPGSPDTCSIAEYGDPKGFYHVKDGKAELRVASIRKFIIPVVNVDNCKTADALVNEIKDRFSSIDKSDSPVVNIILRGTLRFDRSNLNVDSIKELVKNQLNALYVDIRFDLMNDEFFISKLDSNELDRTGIEREVFRKLAQSDSMLAANSDLFAASISEVKDLAIKGADERTLDVVLRNIYEHIRTGTQPAQFVTRVKPVKDETETDVMPAAKKTRKKSPAKGQAALDLGDGL